MLGFSIYLNQEIDEAVEKYINNMKEHNFVGIFTSLHIPEEDISLYKKRITRLATISKKLELELTVDVDEKSLNNIGYSFDDVSELKKLGLTCIRVDYGLNNEEIANLSRQIKVALNASTIIEEDVEELKNAQANFNNLEAWHNYYPRPETGLNIDWYREKNEMLKKSGFKTMGFVPGDKKLRGPLRKGLPTLESHRYKNPLTSAIQLLSETNTDLVYVGDSQLSLNQQEKFLNYFVYNLLQIDVNFFELKPSCLKEPVHSRKDLSEDVIRIEEGRFNVDGTIEANNCINRERGSVTIDNIEYGRYMGEIQITKHDLPQDSKVNVIGKIISDDLDLLEVIEAGQKIVLKNK